MRRAIMFGIIGAMAAAISGCVTDGVKPIYKLPGGVQAVVQRGQEYEPLPNLPLQVIEKDGAIQEIVTDEKGLAIYYLAGTTVNYWLSYGDQGRFPGIAYLITPFVFQMQEGQLKAVKTLEVKR